REFEKYPCNIKRTNYCSTSCFYTRKYERVPVVCEVCGKHFTKKPSHAKRTKNHYCNVSCANKGFHLRVHHYDEDGNLTAKKCSLCSLWLPPENFWKNGSSHAKIGNSCIKCCLKKRYNLTEEEMVSIFELECCSV